jgi:hypothetical protein
MTNQVQRRAREVIMIEYDGGGEGRTGFDTSTWSWYVTLFANYESSIKSALRWYFMRIIETWKQLIDLTWFCVMGAMQNIYLISGCSLLRLENFREPAFGLVAKDNILCVGGHGFETRIGGPYG